MENLKSILSDLDEHKLTKHQAYTLIKILMEGNIDNKKDNMVINSRLKKNDYTPISKDVDKDVLMGFLNRVEIKKIFCVHNWVYWCFGSATKQHRVCRKCFKKQQHSNILSKYDGFWIKDIHFIK